MALVRVYCGLASTPPTAAQQLTTALLTIAVVDDSGRRLDIREITDDPAGYADLGALLAERSGGAGGIAVAADGDEHQVTLLLAAAGRPLAVADEESLDDYADRFCDDESAEEIQATVTVRRALGLARALQAGALAAATQPPPRELMQLKPVLVAHAALATGRQGAAVALREVLRELYPAALRAYPDPAAPIPLAILDALPEPGLLGSGAANRDRDAAVAADLAAAGLADEETVAQAILALRVATDETPRRAGIGSSLTAAAAATIQHAVAAVRACDGGVLALVGLLAEKATPANAGRAPALNGTTRTRRGAQSLASSPGTRSPSSGTRRAVEEPTHTRRPADVSRRDTEDPATNRASTVDRRGMGNGMAALRPGERPGGERPGGERPSAPTRQAGLSANAAQPASDKPRHDSAHRDGTDAAITETPRTRRSTRSTPIAAEALRAISGEIPTLAPESDHATQRHAAGDHIMGGYAPAPLSPGASRTTPAVVSGPPATSAATRSGPLAEPYHPSVSIPVGRPGPDVSRRSTRDGGRGTTDSDTLRPGPAPDIAPPGSRDDWPLNPAARDRDDLAVDPLESAAARAAQDSHSVESLVPQQREGRVPPPWQADDMPSEPAGLRLVEPAPLADRALRDDRSRAMNDSFGGERHTPASDDRRGALAAFGSRSPDRVATAPRRGTDPPHDHHQPAHPPLRLVESDADGRRSERYESANMPIVPDSDGDLLIFAQAKSAWFTGEIAEDTSLSWDNPADLGWQAAERATSPVHGDETAAGLPRRVPQANLVPGSPLPPAQERPLRIVRDAAELAAHTTGYFRGSRQGEQVRGFAVGGRPGREAAGGWDFSRDSWESDHDEDRDYTYRSAARR